LKTNYLPFPTPPRFSDKEDFPLDRQQL